MKYFFRKTGDKSRVGFSYAETTTLFLLSVFLLFPPLISVSIFSQQKLDADYKIGKELVLLQTIANSWYSTKDWNPQKGNLPPMGYRGIYWNPKSNEYFLAYGEELYYNLRMTNGLTYKYDIDKQETNHVDEQKYLQYLGSLSPTERLYLGKDGNQYIKKLTKINDKITVFPYFSKQFTVSYTNSKGEKFSRYLGRDTWTNYGKGELEPF